MLKIKRTKNKREERNPNKQPNFREHWFESNDPRAHVLSIPTLQIGVRDKCQSKYAHAQEP